MTATTAGQTLVIRVPLTPETALGPNWRGFWRTKADAAARLRQAAYYATRDAGSRPATHQTHSAVWYRIAWEKGRRRMDDDNAIAALKALRDGVADALGVNDRDFVVHGVEQTRDPAGLGYVEVHLAWGDVGGFIRPTRCSGPCASTESTMKDSA